jgi:hypothetical protein
VPATAERTDACADERWEKSRMNLVKLDTSKMLVLEISRRRWPKIVCFGSDL